MASLKLPTKRIYTHGSSHFTQLTVLTATGDSGGLSGRWCGPTQLLVYPAVGAHSCWRAELFVLHSGEKLQFGLVPR